jgi:LmbE family N-acetylglucosaminyl deacetylase
MEGAVLVVVAHCDEAELWACGTIARLTAVGAPGRVGIANNSDVRRSEALRGGVELAFEPRFSPDDQLL